MPIMAHHSAFTRKRELDTAVLQYQNQKLLQKLEVLKIEFSALKSKLFQVKKKQSNETILDLMTTTWKSLIDDLEAISNSLKDASSEEENDQASTADAEEGSSCADIYLHRLTESGTTITCRSHIETAKFSFLKIKSILCNATFAVDNLQQMKDQLLEEVTEAFPTDSCRKIMEKEKEVQNLRIVFSNLHVELKLLDLELQKFRALDAKSEVLHATITGELEETKSELQNIDSNLKALQTNNASKDSVFPLRSLENKKSAVERTSDEPRDRQELECVLKEYSDQAAASVLELKSLLKEKIRILQESSNLQSTVKNVKHISGSRPLIAVREQMEKAKSEISNYHKLFENYQTEKDTYTWKERALNLKTDLFDTYQRFSAVTNSRIADLDVAIQKQIDERNVIKSKLEDASKHKGRNEVIAEFKSFVSSFPEKMGRMQQQLSAYKDSASDIHSLNADVCSFSDILDRKAKECQQLYSNAGDQDTEIQRLQSVVGDLQEFQSEMNLILDMFKRESPDSRDISGAKNSEYKAWADVYCLKSFLDEQNLELRVKTANEAEAVSQQKLAAAEAEIADLRQKLSQFRRDLSSLPNVLRSKSDENEAYISEIEAIGQAYSDMHNQNQHLLQQITERDDYNIKLIMDGVKARQLLSSYQLEKQTLEKEIQQANVTIGYLNIKCAKFEDKLKHLCSQIRKVEEDKDHKFGVLENTKKLLQDVKESSFQSGHVLDEKQSKVASDREQLVKARIELENKRFEKRRMEEDVRAARRKVSHLHLQVEGSIVGKLRNELNGYKQLVTCGICSERYKEAVITKCYHLFCSPCLHKIADSRQHKCPTCSASFGPNDVRPVYM